MLLQEPELSNSQKLNSVPDLLGPFGNGSSSSSKSIIPFTKRIEFHPARKPFNGFVNNGGDFKIETLNPSGNSNPTVKSGSGDASAQNGKKVDGSELLDGWLDPEFSFGASVQRIGAGLENLGNTCFLNSVLQCLTYTEPFAAYLQSGKHQISCRINGFCALCAIQKHVSRALKSTGRILAPKDLVVNLRCISRNFRNCRQEDAHEYMVNLLESMHKCCLPSGVPSESPGAYEKSLVHKIFGGHLRSQVKCMQCSYCSNKFDPFLDLSLEIAKAESIVKALRHFTAAEYLDGGEKQYNCQQCKQKVRALKQLTVHKAPYVLTVHLKRFHSHDPGQKINKNVQFDSTLDLKPFVSGNYEEDLKYTLYGVLVHHGWSTHSGHYYCYVRTSTNMWYSLDDNQVRQVSESTVLQQKAYMLFYVRNRRNAAPRKPVDVARKESMKENVGGIRMSFTTNQNSGAPLLKSQITDIGVGASSANTILRDASNGNSLIISREASFKENNPLAGAESHVRKKAVVSSDSKVQSPKESLKEAASLNPISPGCTLVSIKDHNIEHQVRSSSEYSKKGDPRKELIVAASKLTNGSENSAAGDVKVYEKHAALSSSGILGTTSASTPGEKTMRVVGAGRSADENKSKSSQVTVEGASCAQLLGNSERDLALDEAAKSSFSLISSNGTTNVETQECRPHKNVKKRFLKPHVTLHLSSNILFGASLGPHKKHKKSKKLLKRVNSSALANDDMASDLGPSTSGRTKQLSLVSARARPKKKGSKKRAHDMLAKKASNPRCDSLVNNITGELRERRAENGSVLAADYLLEKSFKSNLAAADEMNQKKEPQITKDIRRDTMQNGLMSMLTRGLEETIVAHWDGIELSPSPPPDSNGVENASIGYVLDEWDEEYDRGKRKKVKCSRHEFGGPNYFQQVASEKFKLKMTKLERVSSGNQPFRI